MRSFLVISCILICFAGSFWGCAKEDLGNLDTFFSDTTSGPISKMTAKVNDTLWNADATDAAIQPGQLSLTGIDIEGKRIGLTIYSSSAGDFLLKFGGTNKALFYPDSVTNLAYSSNTNANTGGVVHIASIDTVNSVMSGDFNFISQRVGSKLLKTVTEGVFTNISYTNASSTAPFNVKKNGRKWSYATAEASAKGAVLTVSAANRNRDTIINIEMPANIVASSKAYPLTPNGNYKGTMIEKSYILVTDTTQASLKKYKITPALTILSNNGSVIQGTFSFVATYTDAKARLKTTLNGGSFYLKYK